MMTDTAAAPSAEIILQGLAVVRPAGNLLLVAICPRKAGRIPSSGRLGAGSKHPIADEPVLYGQRHARA